MTTPVLITGGTGLTGSRVARRLAAAGCRVRIGSRAEAPPFDWTRPETWPDALSAVSAASAADGQNGTDRPRAAYLCYPSDIGAPGAAERVGDFLAEARSRGLERVILLSSRGQGSALPTEDAVRGCDLAWTIVRSAWFSQNFTEGALSPWIRAGELPFPAGPPAGPDAVGEPFVDADDLADVIAAVFADDDYVGRTLEVTGPRLWTFGEAVASLAARAGRPIAYRPVTGEEFASMLLDAGMPPDEASALVEGFVEILDGRNASTTDAVERTLGRRPRDFSVVPGGRESE